MTVTSVTIPLRISPELKEKIRFEAKRLGKSQNELMGLAIGHFMLHTAMRPRKINLKDFTEVESEFEGNRLWEAHVDGYDIILRYSLRNIELFCSEWELWISDQLMWDVSIELTPGGTEPNWYEVVKESNKQLQKHANDRIKGWD